MYIYIKVPFEHTDICNSKNFAYFLSKVFQMYKCLTCIIHEVEYCAFVVADESEVKCDSKFGIITLTKQQKVDISCR